MYNKWGTSYGKMILSLLLCCPMIFSCVASTRIVEKGARFIDRSFSRYKTVASWEALNMDDFELSEVTGEDGEAGIVFRADAIPYARFFASVPRGGGACEITKMLFLAASYSGWNEFVIEASGTVRFRPAGSGDAVFSVSGPVTLGKISAGQMLFNNTRLSGEKARTELEHRNTRINFLVGELKKYAAAQGAPRWTNQAGFEAYWNPRLFAGKNTASLILTEELQPLRENGSLDADWSEAVSWIYLYYNWDDLIGVLHRELFLTKK